MAAPSWKEGWKMQSTYLYLPITCGKEAEVFSRKLYFISMKSLGFPSEDVPNRPLDVEM